MMFINNSFVSVTALSFASFVEASNAGLQTSYLRQLGRRRLQNVGAVPAVPEVDSTTLFGELKAKFGDGQWRDGAKDVNKYFEHLNTDIGQAGVDLTNDQQEMLSIVFWAARSRSDNVITLEEVNLYENMRNAMTDPETTLAESDLNTLAKLLTGRELKKDEFGEYVIDKKGYYTVPGKDEMVKEFNVNGDEIPSPYSYLVGKENRFFDEFKEFQDLYDFKIDTMDTATVDLGLGDKMLFTNEAAAAAGENTATATALHDEVAHEMLANESWTTTAGGSALIDAFIGVGGFLGFLFLIFILSKIFSCGK